MYVIGGFFLFFPLCVDLNDIDTKGRMITNGQDCILVGDCRLNALFEFG